MRQSTQVVLLDLKLPGGDSVALFRRVRAVNSEARVILVTRYREEMGPTIGRLLVEGVDAVHYKPFDIPRVLEDLAHLAKGAGGTQSRSVSQGIRRW